MKTRLLLLLSSILFMHCANAAEVDSQVRQMMNAAGNNEDIAVIIRFRDRLDMRAFSDSSMQVRRSKILRALKSKSLSAQRRVRDQLRLRLDNRGMQTVRELWIINALAAKLPASVIEELSAQQEIESITLDAKVNAGGKPSATAYAPEWNLNTIGAQTLWGLGYRGQGVVVGIMDTGVDMFHQDLLDRWRGGSSGWFDPYGEHATPYDALGHGTQVTGIVLGGNASGTAIGVAPDAQWIAAKIFNDAGSATLSMIHQAFQWMLDPDNNPDTNDAPDVVNNAWNLQYTLDSCNAEFQTDIDVLRSADIAVVFSAGNSGPSPSTSLSPANNSGSLATGAVDESLNVVYSSSRGPSACGGGIYPQLSAPGFNINTSDLTFGGAIPNLYTTVSGTSFAAAHISGSLALLKSAVPAAAVSDMESAMMQSAVDVGSSGADNDYGYGVVNVVDAYQLLQSPSPGTPPQAIDDSYAMMEDESLVISAPGVLVNDSGSSITAILTTNVSAGSLVLNPDGSFSFSPDADYSGNVWFEYAANDGTQQSSPARVSIDIAPVNDAPQANDDASTTVRKQSVVIDLLSNDSDIDSLIDPTSIVISSPPSMGTVAVNTDGTVTYTSSGNRPGTDNFSYQVSDMEGAQSSPANVSIQITRR